MVPATTRRYSSSFRDAPKDQTSDVQHCRITSRIVRGVRTVARRACGMPAGPVAQWLEPAAHNGLVASSSLARPTNNIKGFHRPLTLRPFVSQYNNQSFVLRSLRPRLNGPRSLL